MLTHLHKHKLITHQRILTDCSQEKKMTAEDGLHIHSQHCSGNNYCLVEAEETKNKLNVIEAHNMLI